jgi:hypothetical protein
MSLLVAANLSLSAGCVWSPQRTQPRSGALGCCVRGRVACLPRHPEAAQLSFSTRPRLPNIAARAVGGEGVLRWWAPDGRDARSAVVTWLGQPHAARASLQSRKGIQANVRGTRSRQVRREAVVGAPPAAALPEVTCPWEPTIANPSATRHFPSRRRRPRPATDTRA